MLFKTDTLPSNSKMKYESLLSEDLQNLAKEELNEDPKSRATDIEHIRKWIKKQPHLNARTDDWTILRYLRGSKFSLEKTKQNIDTCCTMCTMLPEWLNNRDPQNKQLRKIIELGVILPLLEPDNEGKRVVLVRCGVIDPIKSNIDDIIKAIFLVIDVLMEVDEISSVLGITYILDLEGFSTSHMLAVPITTVKKAMALSQGAYSMRFKGLHFINIASSFELVFNILKGFMKDKMKKRVMVHSGDYSTLYEEVPMKILPKEYGGEKSVKEIVEYWMKIIDVKRDWLLEDDKYRVDESKRPGKPKTTNDMFGIEGSFRKLNVD